MVIQVYLINVFITEIREGMTVVSTLPPSDTEEQDREVILKIFSSIGRCRFLEEKHFDACTALSGSGPAFACIFLEAMADGGVMMGLPRAEALELASQSLYRSSPVQRREFTISCPSALQGAARMVLQSGQHPSQLKDAVTSKLIPQLSLFFLTHCPKLLVDVQLLDCLPWKMVVSARQ